MTSASVSKPANPRRLEDWINGTLYSTAQHQERYVYSQANNESLTSIANTLSGQRIHGSNEFYLDNLTWDLIARFNYGTDVPEEINWYLENFNGTETVVGNNYALTNSDTYPWLWIPKDPRRFAGKTGECTTFIVRTDTLSINEFIIIVGAEDYYTNPGNKMMFMAHAVRYCRKYAGLFDKTTVFYFPGISSDPDEAPVHSLNQIDAFIAGVNRYNGTPVAANSWQDIVDHINNTSYTDGMVNITKKVQVIIFFAHGTPAKGIWLDRKNDEYVDKTNIGHILPTSFVSTATEKYDRIHVTAWACQVGNKGSSTLSIEENMAQSLAQTMADELRVDVFASANRTSFSETWDGFPFGHLDRDRSLIDDAVWEEDGADDSVQSDSTSILSRLILRVT